jgi:hypothetical protein
MPKVWRRTGVCISGHCRKRWNQCYAKSLGIGCCSRTIPSHRSVVAKAYLVSQKLFETLPDWPPRSPDLNPIENLWAWICSRLLRQQTQAQTVEHLQGDIMSILRSNDCRDVCQVLHDSFRSRLQKFLQKGGDYTDH